jgi:hypothetical protein
MLESGYQACPESASPNLRRFSVTPYMEVHRDQTWYGTRSARAGPGGRGGVGVRRVRCAGGAAGGRGRRGGHTREADQSDRPHAARRRGQRHRQPGDLRQLREGTSRAGLEHQLPVRARAGRGRQGTGAADRGHGGHHGGRRWYRRDGRCPHGEPDDAAAAQLRLEPPRPLTGFRRERHRTAGDVGRVRHRQPVQPGRSAARLPPRPGGPAAHHA